MDQREREDAARHERWLKALEKAERERDAALDALETIARACTGADGCSDYARAALTAAGRKVG